MGNRCGSCIYGPVSDLRRYKKRPRSHQANTTPDIQRVRKLLALGMPAAGQILLEVGVFATSTVLAGRLTPESLAAHHILLNIAGTTFMVPLG